MGQVVGVDTVAGMATMSDDLLIAQWQFVQDAVDKAIGRKLRSVEANLPNGCRGCDDAAIVLFDPLSDK